MVVCLSVCECVSVSAGSCSLRQAQLTLVSTPLRLLSSSVAVLSLQNGPTFPNIHIHFHLLLVHPPHFITALFSHFDTFFYLIPFFHSSILHLHSTIPPHRPFHLRDYFYLTPPSCSPNQSVSLTGRVLYTPPSTVVHHSKHILPKSRFYLSLKSIQLKTLCRPSKTPLTALPPPMVPAGPR